MQVAHTYKIKLYDDLEKHADVPFSVPDTITLRDHSDKYGCTTTAPIAMTGPRTCGAGAGDIGWANSGLDHGMVETGVELPSAELLLAHAAIAGVVRMSGAFDLLKDVMFLCCTLYSPAPPSSGTAFWESVVGYEGGDVCSEVDAHYPLVTPAV